MADHDFSWMERPAVFHTADLAALALPANKPIGHRAVVVDKVFEELDYLPARPHDSGMYLCVDLVYPALRIGFSVFELYHSQVDVNLRPKLYITRTPVVGVSGTNFEQSKNAHRLVWVADADAAMKFVEFISSYIFTRRETHEAMSVEPSVLPLSYPSADSIDRKVTCCYLLPFSTRGGYVHDQMGSSMMPYPSFMWQTKDTHAGAKALGVQAEAMWRSS